MNKNSSVCRHVCRLSACTTAAVLSLGTAAAADSGPSLQQVSFSGQLSADAQVNEITSQFYGRSIDAALLERVLQEVSRYYHEQGFRQAAALLPEQVIKEDGVLQIYLANQLLGETTVTDEDEVLWPSARERLFASFADLQGEPVNEDELEGQLLKLTDLGVFNLQGEFSQGRGPIDKELLLDLTRTEYFGITLFADNKGSKAAGRYRYGVQADIFNPTKNADALSLFYARSSENQNNYSISYQIPVNSHPTVIGTSFCLTDYDLGHEYEVLGAEGRSWEWAVFVREPLYRRINHKLQLEAGYRYRSITDEFTEFDIKFKQHSHAGWLVLSNYQSIDDHHFGGSVKFTAGRLFNDDDYKLYDEDFFTIWNISAYYSYSLASYCSLNADLELQLTADNVDSSEEFFVGGANAVSGYDSNVLSGDSGGFIKLYPQITPIPGENFFMRPNFKAGYARDQHCDSQELYSVGLELGYSKMGFFVTLSFDAVVGERPYDDLDQGKFWCELGVRI